MGNGWGSSISSSSVVLAATKSSVQQHVGELVPIYDLLPQDQTLPPHLTPIDPSTLISHEAVSIDKAHRGGKLHIGHVLFVMDDAYDLLFLQRSRDVITCPGTWSVLGEHANSNETPMQSVLRGIQEELGFVRLLNYIDIDGMNGERRESNNNNNDNNDNKNISDIGTTLTEEGVYYFRSSKDDADVESSTSNNIIRARIQNITQYPLYYIRHYGPRNNNRIDSQLTYLWSVVVTTITTTTNNVDQDVDTTNDIQRLMHLDAEVADHKWMNLIEASVWLANDAAKMIMVDSNKNHNNNNVNEEDDGPDMGDFCHSTIRSLYEVGLNSILQQMSK